MSVYHLKLNVIAATNLVTDIPGVNVMDAYVSFKTMRTSKMKTRTYLKSVNPFWCEEFDVDVEDGEDIEFHIKNAKSLKSTIGVAVYHFTEMVVGDVQRAKLPIQEGGELTIKMTCTGID